MGQHAVLGAGVSEANDTDTRAHCPEGEANKKPSEYSVRGEHTPTALTRPGAGGGAFLSTTTPRGCGGHRSAYQLHIY